MKRRLLLAASAGWPAARLLAQEGTPAGRPRRKVSAAELHEALSQKFPLRFGVPPLLELQVRAPQLLLRPARNQLGATLLLEPTGQRLQRQPSGEVDVVFNARYAAADRTLRAHGPEILDIRWPGLPAETRQVLQGLLTSMARETLADFVLHRFSDRDLAVPDTLGFEPETITVLDDGLLVEFAPKPRR